MTDPVDTVVEVLHAIGKLFGKLSADDVKHLLGGDAKLAVVPSTWRPSAGPSTKGNMSAIDPNAVRRDLDGIDNREEAIQYVQSMGLTIANLKQLARGLGVAIPAKINKSPLIERIADDTVGARLSSGAIRGGNW